MKRSILTTDAREWNGPKAPQIPANFIKTLTFFLVFLFAHSAFANIYYVKPAGDDSQAGTSWATAFKTLQKALDEAGAGDEIWVAAGTYYPDEGPGQTDNDRNSHFAMIPEVAIYGGFNGTENHLNQRNWNTNVTILSGDLLQNDGPEFLNNGDNSYHVIYNNYNNLDDDSILDGFTISSGYANLNSWPNSAGGGVLNIQSSPKFANCSFQENYALSAGGGMHNLSSFPVINNCNFSSNKCLGRGGGMFNELHAAPEISNSFFLTMKQNMVEAFTMMKRI